MGFSVKETIEYVKSQENQERISDDLVRYNIYNGKLRDEISKAISKEFKNQDTIAQLNSRIISLNISQRIINALATVYNQPPVRTPKSKDANDQEVLDLYAESFRIDQKMKFSNRSFKNMKHSILDPFLDHEGIPRMRTLSSHTYTVMSDDMLEPDRMTQFVKHIHVDNDEPSKSRFHIWTAENFWIANGEGAIVTDEMEQLGNPEGINPFGVIPQTFISESDDGNLIPISDDDLVNMSIVVPLLYTDLAFASKFQLWSTFVITGADDANVDMSPNSILSLPDGADFKSVKPEVDIDKAIMLIENMVATLLTTKNLSAGEVTGSMSASSSASGVAKLLDEAVSTEDKKDQEQFFRDGEKEHWDKFAHKILPVWVQAGQVHKDYIGSFSEDFELSIRFADPKPFIGDKELVELESMKKSEGFTTQKLALKTIHPDMDDDEIDQLMEGVGKEKKERLQEMQKTMAKAGNPFEKKDDTDQDEQGDDNEDA